MKETARMSQASRDLRLLLQEAGMDGLDVGRLIREFGGDAARPVEEYEAFFRIGRGMDANNTAATRAGPGETNGEDRVRAVA